MSLPVLARFSQRNHSIESENDTALCCAYSTSTLSVSFALLGNVSVAPRYQKRLLLSFDFSLIQFEKKLAKLFYFSSFRFSSLY